MSHSASRVVIHDPINDELRTDHYYTVLDQGRLRVLRLRIARGYLTRGACACCGLEQGHKTGCQQGET